MDIDSNNEVKELKSAEKWQVLGLIRALWASNFHGNGPSCRVQGNCGDAENADCERVGVSRRILTSRDVRVNGLVGDERGNGIYFF